MLKLRLLLKEFNLEPPFNRTVVQKTVYILQRMGLNFGYTFRWCSRRPYSPELNCDLHEIELLAQAAKPQRECTAGM